MNFTIGATGRNLALTLCAAAMLVPGALKAQTVTISPGYTSIGVNQTLQYTAAVTGLANSAVTWSVVGVVGGNATYGKITQTGLYTAPPAIPANGITVSALASDGKTMGIVYVNIAPAGPTIAAIAPNPIPTGSYSITLTGAGFQSGAIVQAVGANLSTTFVNSTTLKASGYQGQAGAVVFIAMNPGSLWGPGFTATFAAPQAISPATATVKLGATQQFTSAGATGWATTAGTVTTGGLYTAPAVMPASSSVTVTATGPGGSAKATVTLSAPNPQTIDPKNPTLKLGATQQFTSAGATGWAASAGTVTGSGLYTAPSVMPASGTAAVTATGPGGSATANVTLTAPSASPQTIAPTSVTLLLGATQQFTSAGATGWAATAGTVTTGGLYAAPAAMPASSTVTVTATGPGGSAKATVTLTSPTLQTIAPTSVTLNLGATQQFTSAGATGWAAVSGTITTAGFYTAPAALPASGADTVTVTGTNGNAMATVTLVPPKPVITGVGNGQLPLGIFSATIAGAGFIASSVAQLNGTALTTTYSGGELNVTGFYGQSGLANITVSNGALVSQPFPVQVGIANAQVSVAASHRFLEQAAFGPTPSDAANVQTSGYQAWLAQQFNMAPVSNYNSVTGDQGGMPGQFLTNAVVNPDQLRQRVAFALSQIFVVSLQKIIWNGNMVLFQNMLLNDAFTNYRQIMGDVTLSPAMGQYLDMANNAMADPATGSLANENYARELMQLFTTGVNMLNPDGSIQYDINNIPIPTYSQFTITEFARVYTGWTYAPAPGQTPSFGEYISGYGPMVPVASEHDSGLKQLLNGYVSAAGVTPLQDLNNALDNIFNHPNVGPFVGRLLIQHLVKSNPSAAYISRVAAAFNNNGSGVRGDMQAVITAILTDPEARANDNGGNDQPTDGHLQEPALFIAGMVRAFGGQMTNQNYFPWDLGNLGQDLFNPESVFNYYMPDYQVPGTSLVGGEFQIHTPNNAVWRANMVHSLFGSYSNPVQNYGPGTTVDLTAFLPLASAPATLVNALDLTLTHGVMPAAMKEAVVAAVTADTMGPLHQVENACYLILTSSYYNIWH